MNNTYIAKTFYEVIGKFNPYHDRLGRFASGSGFMASGWTGDKDKQAVTFSANPNTTYGARAIARESGQAHEVIGRAYGAGPSTATKPPKSSKPTAKPQKQPKPKTEKPKTDKPKDNKDDKVSEFKPAKTKKEAIEYAKKQLGFETVSYGTKLDIETINHINKQVADIQAKYPETKGAVQTLKTLTSNYIYAAIEYDSSGTLTFKVSSRLYGEGLNSLEKSYKSNVDSGFHPKGTTAKDIIWHEYGHVIGAINSKRDVGLVANETLDFGSRLQFMNARRYGTWEKEVYDKAAKTMKEYHKVSSIPGHGGKIPVDYRHMARKISRYAEKNVKELFAEAFAEFNGSDNPSPECIALMKAAGLFK